MCMQEFSKIILYPEKERVQMINLGRGFRRGLFQSNRVLHSQQTTQPRSEEARRTGSSILNRDHQQCFDLT